MGRLSWREMRDYWERHEELRAPVDLADDPEGLANVCHPGQPVWLNRYHARIQRQVFRELLSLVPARTPSARALDVGCGAGRWSRVLADEGYYTVGIDLQGGLIEASRRRYPDIEFHKASVQEFTSEQPFDLISTVTVIQHVPFEEQVTVVERLQSLMRAGGHVIALENVSDQGPHVFARSSGEWRKLFQAAGFEPLEERPYDYSPGRRSLERLKRRLVSARRGPGSPPTAETLNTTGQRVTGSSRRLGASAYRAVLRACVGVDAAIEPGCIRLAPPVPTVHCGFLFRAV